MSKPINAPSLARLSDLTADPLNPRDIKLENLEGLKYSLSEFGDLSGFVWNVRTHELVCGHQRTRGTIEEHGDLEIKDLGVGADPRFYFTTPAGQRFPIRVVDWDRKKQRAANLAANNPHLAGHFTDALQPQLKELAAADAELMNALRLDELVLQDVLLEDDPGAGATPPPLPKVATTKLGDMYLLGRHRLVCGDCRNPEAVATLMNGESADMIVTDPPYNVDYVGKTKSAKKIENDKMSAEDFLEFLKAAHASMYANAKPGAAIYVFHADIEGENFRRAFRESGFLLKQTLVWVKDTLVMGRQDYQWQHEPILYGWKDGAAHRWFADRKQTTLWRFARPTVSEDHPTMKPLDMIGYALRCSSRPGDLVADFFGGSGTMLIAAEKARRRAVTMELDPLYCDVIVRRWEDMTGKKAGLIPAAVGDKLNRALIQQDPEYVGRLEGLPKSAPGIVTYNAKRFPDGPPALDLSGMVMPTATRLRGKGVRGDDSLVGNEETLGAGEEPWENIEVPEGRSPIEEMGAVLADQMAAQQSLAKAARKKPKAKKKAKKAPRR